MSFLRRLGSLWLGKVVLASSVIALLCKRGVFQVCLGLRVEADLVQYRLLLMFQARLLKSCCFMFRGAAACVVLQMEALQAIYGDDFQLIKGSGCDWPAFSVRVSKLPCGPKRIWQVESAAVTNHLCDCSSDPSCSTCY